MQFKNMLLVKWVRSNQTMEYHIYLQKNKGSTTHADSTSFRILSRMFDTWKMVWIRLEQQKPNREHTGLQFVTAKHRLLRCNKPSAVEENNYKKNSK